MDANYFLDSGLVEDAAAAGLDVSGLSSGLGGSAGELSNGHGNGNSHDDAPGNGNGNLTGPGTSNSGGVQTHAALGPGGKKISKKGKNKSAAEKASKRASGLESGAEAGGSGAAGADATAEDSEADMSGYASAAGGMERSFGRAGLAANGHAKDVDMMDS